MKCDKHAMLLYAVTDRAWTGRETLRQQVEDALKGGVTCVQLREKELDDAAFLQEAMELSALCRSYGVPFIINDNVEIAIKCHADGNKQNTDNGSKQLGNRMRESMLEISAVIHNRGGEVGKILFAKESQRQLAKFFRQ